ncbi:MAG: hypothetical protein AB7N76_21495 [Planctomycetota bacterium]
MSVQVALSYGLPSGVEWGSQAARVRLAGAKERPRLSYRGAVKDPLVLRELMGALYDVVIADFRFRPSAQREQFQRWLVAKLDREAAAERARIEAERRRYLQWLWEQERAAWLILDPVCSVHPDQLFFEAFSRDGSAYARVGVDRGAMEESGEVVCGTTNVDFSAGLYEAIRRLRSIWRTELALGDAAAGEAKLEVATEGAVRHTEKKVEVPEGWLRGFVQIGAAFLLPTLQVELDPIHVQELCRVLHHRRAKVSPRALRWELRPGQPASVVFEPWEHRLTFHGSRHGATEERIVRIWGRRRLCLIERVIPVAERFTFHLLGRGLPYFVTARAGALDFTLGLSGWTKTDWTSTARFDALIARRGGGAQPSPKPLAWLQQHHRGAPAEIAAALGLSAAEVHASLAEAAGQGLVIYDLLHQVYRHRPLLATPLPAEATLGADPQARDARALLARKAAAITGVRGVPAGRNLRGRVSEDPTHVYEPEVVLDDQGRVVEGACGCWFAKQHGLKQGLCAHQHALLLLDDALAQ